jgi:hypothetical protein
MALKSFYYQYGYKEFILKETLDENIHLRKNNFYLNKLNIFLPIFESKEIKKYKRSKLNKVLFLYFLYQSFFNKNLRIVFKKTLGTPRKILKKKESSYQDILGFKVTLNSTEVFEFFKNFIYDFFFKSLCEKNTPSYKNIFFKQSRSQQDKNFILKFNLNTFFDLHIFFLLKDELYLDFIDDSYLNFYFKTNSISRKINCLRFIYFPLEYKKINHKH